MDEQKQMDYEQSLKSVLRRQLQEGLKFAAIEDWQLDVLSTQLGYINAHALKYAQDITMEAAKSGKHEAEALANIFKMMKEAMVIELVTNNGVVQNFLKNLR